MLEHFRKNTGRYMVGLIAVLLVVAGLFVWRFWDWLRIVPPGYESGTATVRNLGLLVTAIIALPLAIWRSVVADRQARTAQQGLLNERYQKGAEMLGSEILSVRLGGIYALQRLAEESPEQYHVPIIQLFCTFARNPTDSEESQGNPKNQPSHKPALREDVQAVMTAIGGRTKTGINDEKSTKSSWLEVTSWSEPHGGERVTVRRGGHFWLDLRGAKLNGADLCEAELSSANFSGADLSHARLLEANLSTAIFSGGKTNLSGAILYRANLSDTDLNFADLSHANLASANLSNAKLVGANLSNAEFADANLPDAVLHRANLTGANLFGVTGLTQIELNGARAIPDKPPRLDNAFDLKTGKPLEWHGRPLENK